MNNDNSKKSTSVDLDTLSINTIRFLSIDAVQKANSGHPSLPMGAAASAYVLWTRFLKHNPANPKWPDRDRFVKPLADVELQRLQALVMRRRQLIQMMVGEQHRLRIAHAAAHPSIERVVSFLKKELADTDTSVAEHVERHHAELAEALRSVPGIGAASVAVVLAELPELGKLRKDKL